MTDTDKVRTYAQLLSSVQVESNDLRAAATDLSQHIKEFENWLNRLPGKTRTELWKFSDNCYFDDGKLAGSVSIGLKFDRQGKAWVIRYTYRSEDEFGEDIEWHRLTDASIEVKLEASQHFGALLEKIASAQRQQLDELRTACNDIGSLTMAVQMFTGNKAGE